MVHAPNRVVWWLPKFLTVPFTLSSSAPFALSVSKGAESGLRREPLGLSSGGRFSPSVPPAKPFLIQCTSP